MIISKFKYSNIVFLLLLIACLSLVSCVPKNSQNPYYADEEEQNMQQNTEFANTNPLAPWNDPLQKDDPLAPWNDPLRKDDPLEPWNDPYHVGY